MAKEQRLIDANEAFETVTDLAGQASTKSAYAAFWKAGRAIQNLNTVDAAEVVRCKDCIHFLQEEHGCNYFGYYSHIPWVDEVDFCSYGERKDNE
jgi:hypothetical protein